MSSSISSSKSEMFLSSIASFSASEKGLVHSFLLIHGLFPDIVSKAAFNSLQGSSGGLQSESESAYESSYKSACSISKSVLGSSAFSTTIAKIVPGDIYNSLESQIGKGKYKSMGKVTLKRIYYQEVGLSFLEKSDAWVKEHMLQQKAEDEVELEEHKKKVRYLVNHASLVLEIHCHGRGDADIRNPLYIRAEKVGAPADMAGIIVSWDKTFRKDDARTIVRCVECTVAFDHLKDVEDILEKFEPLDYSMASSNCRDYAEATYKALLQECIRRGGDEKRLQKEADEIEIHLGHMMVQDVKEAVHKAFRFISTYLEVPV